MKQLLSPRKEKAKMLSTAFKKSVQPAEGSSCYAQVRGRLEENTGSWTVPTHSLRTLENQIQGTLSSLFIPDQESSQAATTTGF